MLAPKKVIDKSDEDRERIRATLMRSFLFKHGDAAQTADLVNAMYEVRRPRGVDIIKQGDREANEFFIIDAGECDIIKGTNEDGSERRLVTLRPGAVFGELALMYNTPRAATVRAASDEVVLWAMDRESFKAIVRAHARLRRAPLAPAHAHAAATRLLARARAPMAAGARADDAEALEIRGVPRGGEPAPRPLVVRARDCRRLVRRSAVRRGRPRDRGGGRGARHVLPRRGQGGGAGQGERRAYL